MGEVNKKMRRLIYNILTLYPILKGLTHYSIKGLTKEEFNSLKNHAIKDGRLLTNNPSKDEIINIMNSRIYEDAIEVITKIYLPIITTIATVIIAFVAITK